MTDPMRVRCEIENEIALVTIDGPPFNTFTHAMMADFETIIKDLHQKKLRAVVITGVGPVFQAGADINIFLETKTEEEGRELIKKVQDMLSLVAELTCPTIAAVNGLALGGGTELALACDIRLAARSATFGLPEVKFGLIPGAGGTQRAARLLGPGRAKMLIFSGEIIDAAEAFRLGLVDRVVENDQLLEQALKLAKKIASRSPMAVRAAKQAIQQGLEVGLRDGLKIERVCLELLIREGETAEGAGAFLEKRKPNFTK